MTSATGQPVGGTPKNLANSSKNASWREFLMGFSRQLHLNGLAYGGNVPGPLLHQQVS